MTRRFCAATVLALFALMAACVLAPGPSRAQGPASLRMHVPFEPTVFSGGGRNNLFYELNLTNAGGTALTVERIEVRDAAGNMPVAAFDAAALDGMVQTTGDGAKPSRQIAPGASLVVFMEIALTPGVPIPGKLVHHVLAGGAGADGAAIATHAVRLQELAPPLEGSGWLASDGPGNEPDNHHRRGIVASDGTPMIARRYAIDWIKKENGVAFSGNARDVHNYYSYGSTVLAVGDGRVVAAIDEWPDNVPGHDEDFHPAVPITMDNVAGNTITLDLGDDQYAHYMHLQPGSVLVRTGDRVKRGQAIAKVGGTGDAREPHLHFQVTTSPNPLAGEGIPYLIDRFGVTAADGTVQPRAHALPMNNETVTFRSVSP